MNSKKLIFIVVLLALLGVGWIAAMQASDDSEIIETQNALVERADVLAEKELYIRAIPLYLEALGYETESNAKIEEKLLSTYYNFGVYDDYCALVEKRSDDQTATENEYATAVQIYASSNKIEDGVKLVKEGMARLNSETLIELYEDIRYPYTVKITKYSEIVPTASNMTMPAKLDDEWCFVSGGGQRLFATAYPELTAPNAAGYSVAKIGETYYVLDPEGYKYGLDETGLEAVVGVNDTFVIGMKDGKYGYYSYDFELMSEELQFDAITVNSEGYGAVKNGDKWAIITDNGNLVTDFIYDEIATNSYGAIFTNGICMVKQSGSWQIITSFGETFGEKLIDELFPDIKAYEGGGYIAVANEDSKWGFIDLSGELVIDYQYNDAYSFSQHLAAVKHGKEWGYISERGELVIEELFYDARPFRNGVAQTVMPDGAALVTLRFVED